MAVLRLTNLYNIIWLTSWARWSLSDMFVERIMCVNYMYYIPILQMQCFSKRCLLAFTENQALERIFSFEVATWQSQTHKNSVTSMQHLSHVFPHLLFLRFTAKDSQNLPSIEDGNTFVVTCQMSFNFYLIWLNWTNTSHQLEPTY